MSVIINVPKTGILTYLNLNNLYKILHIVSAISVGYPMNVIGPPAIAKTPLIPNKDSGNEANIIIISDLV